MPDFNSPDAKNKFLDNHYKNKAAEISAKEKEQRSDDRAEKAYRQNRTLLIFTIILGFLGVAVDILSNLDRIISNLSLLLCR